MSTSCIPHTLPNSVMFAGQQKRTRQRFLRDSRTCYCFSGHTEELDQLLVDAVGVVGHVDFQGGSGVTFRHDVHLRSSFQEVSHNLNAPLVARGTFCKRPVFSEFPGTTAQRGRCPHLLHRVLRGNK